jgi:uncharacterized protein YbjT (DUF2867 family)/quinol monooxygenase YgiN
VYAISIRLHAVDEAGAAILRQASLDVVAPSLAEPGCLFFDVLLEEEDPLLVRFYEAYIDEAAAQAHTRTPHAKEWLARCLPVLDRATIKNPESISDHGAPGLDRVVAVFGATGRIGSELVKLLAADPRCKEVRALTRNPESASSIRVGAFGPEVRVTKFDRNDLVPACDGATDAFVIAPLSDDFVGLHEDVAEALAEANVEHVVKVSVTGARSPDSDPPPGKFPSMHWAGEEALRSRVRKVTVIRPTIFMQHFEMNTGLYTQGADRFYLPTGDTPVAFLDCRDIAAMGHALLLSPRAVPFHGGAFELTGSEAVTGARIAEVLAAVRRAPVEHVDGVEAFSARCAELGMGDWAKHVYAEAEQGWFSPLSTEAFEAVVGRKPRSFAAYADDRAPWFSKPS